MNKTTKQKKKLKLKGLTIFKLFVYLNGKKDAENGRIYVLEGAYISAFLQRKNHDFVCYAARLRDITKKINQSACEQLIAFDVELNRLQELSVIEKEKALELKGRLNEIDMVRAERNQEKNLKVIREKIDAVKTKREMIIENIIQNEHETEQMLLDAENKLGKLMNVYLQGAARHLEIYKDKTKITLNENRAKELYVSHCKLTEQLKMAQ